MSGDDRPGRTALERAGFFRIPNRPNHWDYCPLCRGLGESEQVACTCPLGTTGSKGR